jgi:hypothetical protein
MMEEQEAAALIKERVRERYAKIALTGNSDCCCMPGECCSDVVLVVTALLHPYKLLRL